MVYHSREQKHNFWATVCKTVRPMLLDRCLSVCNVGVLWPNGWTNQDETSRAGRPRPWPHCVRWEPSSPSPKGGGAPQFSAHICCGQMAGWINMPLGMEVGLGPGDFVLDGYPVPLPKNWAEPLSNFRPMSILAKRLHGSRWHLGWRWSRPHCARWGPSSCPPKKWCGAPSPTFRTIYIVAKRLDASRCHLVWKYASARATLC